MTEPDTQADSTRATPPRPLRILHVVTSLEIGGLENGIVNVARRLDPQEFEIHCLCVDRRGGFADRLPNQDNLIVLNKPPGISLKAIWQTGSALRRIRPDVVHTHNLGPLLYGALGGWLAGRPPLLHGEHSMIVEEERTETLVGLRHWLWRRADRVHTVSEMLKRHFIEWGFPGEGVEVIINGVDTERFSAVAKAHARQQAAVPQDAQVLGIVGSFNVRKRHPLLIESFNLFAAKHPRAHLLIVGGEGPEKENVTRLAKASPFADRIVLAGHQPEPRPFYQAMDLLAVPSNNEGLSNAMLEAMACETPVLANTTCGSADVIAAGEDGLVADLDVPEGFAEMLEHAFASPTNLAELGRRARAKVEKQFALQSMASAYAALYRAMAARKR